MREIIVISGDGIGPEIMSSTLEVLDVFQLPLSYIPVDIGAKAFEKTGELIPKEVFELIAEKKIALKGPVTTPIGHGFRSVNVALRKHFDLYANIRPIKTYGKIPRRYPEVDLVIFRENTEDLYAGIEHQVSEDEAHSTKVITRAGSRRIAHQAFAYAKAHSKNKVTTVTKANIMKLTDGMFLDEARKEARAYPNITHEEVLIDNMAMQLVLDPTPFELILTENLYGDILSDLCAALIGGIGLAPGANMGDEVAIFEAVHGSAPDIAGRDLANPTALLLSASMMLDHLGYLEEGALLRQAIDRYLSEAKNFTRDLGGSQSTTGFTQGLISVLKGLKEGNHA